MKLLKPLNIFPKVVFCRRASDQAKLTLVSEQNGVRRITLNNPKKRNALSSLMLESLSNDIFKDVDDISVRCIVLNSNGPVFSSGHDLKELKTAGKEMQEKIFAKCCELMIGIKKIPIPVIVQVHGLAAAAGCQLVASCDIVIATTNAQFSTPGASVGLFCSTPGVAVSRAVSPKMAAYMLLTGNTISAQEAYNSGLVSKIVPEDRVEVATNEILQAILQKSKSVIALGKEFFYQQLNSDIETAYSEGSKVMINNLAIEDAQEGISAFLEKRIPKWKHTNELLK